MMNDQITKQCKQILMKNHLHPIRKLGKGAFATVFLVEKIQLQKNLNQLYSVKCINKKLFVKRPSLNKYIKQEIQISRNIEHENIVRSLRTFEDQGWIFMVMQYCDLGNLSTKVSSSPNSVLTISQTFYICSQVIKGLQYMHDRNLIHRDIKAQNILLATKRTKAKTRLSDKGFQFVAKICDLGFTREENEDVNTFCGTTYYMAPEIFQKTNYDYKVDIWALGVLVFFMLFGQFPFKSINIEFEIQKKCQKGFSLSSINNLKQNNSISKQDMKTLQQFFSKIFTIKPASRMSLCQLKQYPWLKQSFQPTHSLSTKPSYPSLKTTQQSDSSQQQKDQSQIQFQLSKYFFLKQIITEVESYKFLKPTEQLPFKYYMYKMLVSEFGRILNEQQKHKSIYKTQIDVLMRNLETHTKWMINNLAKLQILKMEVTKFDPKAKNFSNFKQSYRLVIGHVFAKAHKNITQDVHKRSQLKLKLFICHVVNRVFDPQHNQGIFNHFYSFLKKNKISQKQPNRQSFCIKSFKKWIQMQDPEKLVQTVEIMNTKFYKGK